MPTKPKLNTSSETALNSILRTMDKMKEALSEIVKKCESDKTPADREETLYGIEELVTVFIAVAGRLEDVLQTEREPATDNKGTSKKVKFFDVAKNLKEHLKGRQRELSDILRDFTAANKAGINRDKTICFERVEALSRELQSETMTFHRAISAEKHEWFNAISKYHDGNRDNLIYR